jgi:MFS superfamily sulfate permease-like transporter
MGVVILAVLGIFLALHFIFPEVTLWPALLVALAVVTMIAAHVQRDGHHARRDREAPVQAGE